MKKLIVFTDLDGTLLDIRYSFKKALPAIELLKENNIPLVICSSKTRSEIEHYRRKLKNQHPFISENGGGIFIPKDYFKLKIKSLRLNIKEKEGYLVVTFGKPYQELRKALDELRLEGFDIKGFGDMSVKEISELTGLTSSEARLAKKRDFDEPFMFKGNANSLKKLGARIKSMGLNFTQGEFFHLMGNTNKGRAVEVLKEFYTRQCGGIVTIAIGDGLNDIEMLKRVDYPVVVKKPDGRYDRRIRLKDLIRANGIGPQGWNKAIIELLSSNYLKPCSSDGNTPFSTSSL
jgi:mannosyl-3-phosphoglycerate phosphatase